MRRNDGINSVKNCIFCDKSFERRRRSNGRLEDAVDWRNRRFCSQECYHSFTVGSNHHNYKNDIRHGHDGGYLRDSNGKYIHRVVVEKHLGRKLSSIEHVHHKDGNVLNNSIENLELTNNSMHRKLHAAICKRDKDGRFA